MTRDRITIVLFMMLSSFGCAKDGEESVEKAVEKAPDATPTGNSRPQGGAGVDPESREEYGLATLMSGMTHSAMSSGTPTNEGYVDFTDKDTGESVTIYVTDHTGAPLSGAQVAFFDGSDFELFVVRKEGYMPQTRVFPHNSFHDFILTPASIKPSLAAFKYSGDQSPEIHYAGWFVATSGKYIGCYTKGQIATKNAIYSLILSLGLPVPGSDAVSYIINTVETINNYIGVAADLGLIDSIEYDGVHRVVYTPQKGQNTFASIIVDMPFTFSDEVCSNEIDDSGNDLDDNCNGEVDEQCDGGQECALYASTVCVGNSVYFQDSCGNLGEMFTPCESSEHCEDGECILTESPTCTSHASKGCYNNAVYWKDSCGNAEEKIKECGDNAACENGMCKPKPPTVEDMVLISAGEFWMGCNEAVDSDCFSTEFPYHKVYLDAYYIDIYEVTAAKYKECVKASSCSSVKDFLCGDWMDSTYNTPGKEQHPINCIDWDYAVDYCAWAGGRLPTEAEWERAARGLDGRKFPWGNAEPTCEFANFSPGGNTCAGGTLPVGSHSKGKSQDGLYDMAGNVREWVKDWYSDAYYSSSPYANPQGASIGSVDGPGIRGGTFESKAPGIRASARYGGFSPLMRAGNLGFRCARSAP